MAAPPSPRPPKAQSVDSEAPLSLFIDTDLGTRLAMVAAPDTTIRRLKSHVAAEHVAAFPDIGPVDVKSFQVHRKGALYHLSESMTVKSAFTRVKGSFFLHVKMVERRCCQGAPEIDGRGTSAGQVGIHLENHDRKLPAAIPEVLDDVLLPPSAQLDAEIKNASEGLAIDADNNKSAKQTNTSHVVEVDAKEYFLQGSRDHEVDGNVSDNKKFMIEESMLGQMHAMNDIFRGKNHKKAKRTDSVHLSATDPRITDESDTMDIDTSLGKAVNDNIPEGSLRKENPGIVSKKKKRRIHQLASSETVSGEETTDLPTGAMGLSKSVADASEVELTNRDGSKARSTVLLLSSEHNDENQGGKHVEFVNNAHASTDLTSEQGNIDHVHNDDKNSSIGDAINSTAEVPASSEKIAGGSNGPWNGEENHEEIKHHKYNEDGHGGVAETGNIEKGSLRKENPGTVSKKKKRRRHQLASSETVSGEETTDLPTGAMGLSKSVAVLLLSSEHNDENQGGKHVEFVNNAQASTDLTSERGNIDHVHNDDKNSSIGDAINSTAEVPASGEKIAGGSNGPWNGEGKHEEIKHHKYNEDGHGGVAETGNMEKGSLRKENPGTVSKKKKRRRHQLASSETVSGEETTDLPTGTMGLSKSVADASEVELTNGDGSKARSTVLLLSSEHNDENQGGKLVEFVNNAQASTDLTSEQGNIDHVHNDDKNSSIGDAINSTAEVPASGEKFAGGSDGPWNGEEKHEEIKHHKYNEDGHGGIAETGNMEKDGKNTDIMENRPTTDNIPKEKKRKKVKKVSSVDMTSMDTAGNKQILGHTENAGKSDKVYTEREVLHSPYMEPVSDNVQQGGSAVIGSPNGDGKRKKKRRRQSESSNGAELNQDQIKSAEHVSNVISIQDTNSAPLDAQQMTQGNVDVAAASDQKFGGSLDIAAANMIDEVLADLKSRDSLSEDLCENMLTGQIHRDSNPNSLEHPAPADIKVGNYAALPLKYPEDIHSNVPASSSPSHKKPKGKQLKVKLTDSSHHSGGMLEGDANTEQKESDTLRFSGKESGLKDGLTGDVRVQDVSKDKSTKRKKKVKGTSDTGKLAQPSSDEQVNQVPRVDMVGVNASIQEDLAQGGSMIDTLMETVTDVQLKGKRASKTRASKIQGTITHRLKDCQDGNATGITGTHDNENASGYPTESSVVQKDAATLEFSSPNAQKEKEKPLRTELQSQDSAMEHDPNADLVHCSAGKGFVSPKSSDAVEPNHCTFAHPASDKSNFIDHFSLGKINDELVSAESIQNNEDETLEAKNKKNNAHKTGPNDLESPAEKTSLMDHLSTSEVFAPPAKAENMSREYGNVKSDKVKRKKKRKTNSEGPAADKENFDDDHQGTGIGTQDSLNSSVQKGRMGQCNGNKNNRAIQNVSPQQQEPEDVLFDRIVEKKLHQGDVDSQNNLPISKDNANVSKELQKSTSQKKPRAKSSKPDVSNIVKSFSMHSAASSDSAGGTPQIANRYRLAVRKVSRKKYEQDNTKSKKESRKVGSGAIFSNAISEESDDAIDTKGEKAAFEASSDNSSTYADSGISSAPYEESDVDDGALSLSQKSLKGVHIGSILRGSRSYKKAKQKQAELLDDDTEVPDSQPADDLWG